VSQRRTVDPELNWQYLACLTDGEGHIRATDLAPILSWTQCAKNAFWLDHVLRFLEGEGIRVSDNAYTYKFSFRILSVTAIEDMRECLTQMFPFLILKQQVAEDAIAFFDKKLKAREKREQYCVNGHARTKKNWKQLPGGRWYCRPCRTDWQRRQRAKVA
jgi:hypothetical protein